ncbi:hypothetical protein M0811_02147 [Anaeramoeba ignava]|uniref:PH domain-containing protein n=1 Tax=Anaeramoeba ignava TaxID=1746090 RepID=A0A9Q0LB05_ANAIG|nr:hypothetical protein M0811_02147 [Anaeramoeba ignava]
MEIEIGIEIGEKIYIEGFLLKKGLIVQSFRKRYFVANQFCIKYSKKENEKPRGIIFLSDIEKISMLEEKFLQIFTPTRIFFISCLTKINRDKWFKALNYLLIGYRQEVSLDDEYFQKRVQFQPETVSESEVEVEVEFESQLQSFSNGEEKINSFDLNKQNIPKREKLEREVFTVSNKKPETKSIKSNQEIAMNPNSN